MQEDAKRVADGQAAREAINPSKSKNEPSETAPAPTSVPLPEVSPLVAPEAPVVPDVPDLPVAPALPDVPDVPVVPVVSPLAAPVAPAVPDVPELPKAPEVAAETPEPTPESFPATYLQCAPYRRCRYGVRRSWFP